VACNCRVGGDEKCIERFARENMKGRNHVGEVGLGGIEVLTAPFVKRSVLWDIAPCSPLKIAVVSEEHVAS
jgi:hypothetical protein